MESSVPSRERHLPLPDVAALSISTGDIDLHVRESLQPEIVFKACSSELFDVEQASSGVLVLRQKRLFWEDRASSSRPSIGWLFQRPSLEVGLPTGKKLQRLALSCRGIVHLDGVIAEELDVRMLKGSIACHRVRADVMRIRLETASALMAECRIAEELSVVVRSGRLEARGLLPASWGYRIHELSGLVTLGSRRLLAHTASSAQGGLLCEVDCRGGRVEIA